MLFCSLKKALSPNNLCSCCFFDVINSVLFNFFLFFFCFYILFLIFICFYINTLLSCFRTLAVILVSDFSLCIIIITIIKVIFSFFLSFPLSFLFRNSTVQTPNKRASSAVDGQRSSDGRTSLLVETQTNPARLQRQLR